MAAYAEMTRVHVPSGVLEDVEIEGLGWGLGVSVVAGGLAVGVQGDFHLTLARALLVEEDELGLGKSEPAPAAPRNADVDVLECPRCGRRIRLIAAIHPPEATHAILGCLALPSRADPPAAPPVPDPEPCPGDFEASP